MELLVLSPSACVGSTHQWEVTRSSYSSVLSLFRSVRSQVLIQPERPESVEAVCQRARRQKFSRSYEVALEMQLTDASPPPSYQMSAALLDFGQTFRGLSMYTCSVSTSSVLLEGYLGDFSCSTTVKCSRVNSVYTVSVSDTNVAATWLQLYVRGCYSDTMVMSLHPNDASVGCLRSWDISGQWVD